MKWVWRALIALLLIVTGTVSGIWFWLHADLPEYESTVRIEGVEAPVQIMFDANAVPHIFAANDGDAYFALGYVHAQERLWQMELQRRIGAGRLSELRFIGANGLPADRLFRTLGAYRDAVASYEGLAPEVRRALDTYAAGVNAWIAGHADALPPEFRLLGLTPEPWRPADSLVWGRLIALQLSENYRGELLRARLASALTPQQMADLFPDGTGAPPTTLAALSPAFLDSVAAALPPPLGPSTASNEWVLAGARTESGRPLLANDPHLSLSAPILWYLARIETPGLSVTGATVPGVPFTLLGHNKRIAWGITTTGSDVQDLFIERLDPQDPDRYLTPDGSAPFEIREETIAVHGAAPVTIRVRTTRHGPVISDISPDAAEAAGEGHVLALAYVALGPEDTASEAIYALNRAEGWDDFLAALQKWRAPQQNVVYADVDGNIGFFAPGLVPIRRDGDGLYPVPGWTGAHDWTGTIPFTELPQAYNPPQQRIVNANNAVVGPDYPYLIAKSYDEPYRAARIEQMLADGGPQTVESAAAMLLDPVSLAAVDLLPVMLTVRADDALSAEVLAGLRRWDGSMDRNAREPLIFNAWLDALGRALYADELGPLAADYDGFRPIVVKRMLTTRRAWCDDVRTEATETCDEVLQASLAAALASLADAYGDDPASWRWGDAHQAPFSHSLWSRIPLADRLLDLSVETDGGQFTVNRAAMPLSGPNPFADVHGAGYRAVYDLAALDNSRFIIATGQSGNPLSPYFGNLTIPWRDGELFPLAGAPGALAEDGIGTITLRPAE